MERRKDERFTRPPRGPGFAFFLFDSEPSFLIPRPSSVILLRSVFTIPQGHRSNLSMKLGATMYVGDTSPAPAAFGALLALNVKATLPELRKLGNDPFSSRMV